jgi:hypothetical protein
MKLTAIKNVIHSESAYNSSLKDLEGTRDFLNDLNKFLYINNQTAKKPVSYSKSKYLEQADQASKTLNYLPKKNIKFVPTTLFSYGSGYGSGSGTGLGSITGVGGSGGSAGNGVGAGNISGINSPNLNYRSSSIDSLFGKNINSPSISIQNNDVILNSQYYKQGFHNKTLDSDYINFKTNFIIKFSKNVGNYDKLKSLVDSVSDNNKKWVLDGLKNLKSLSEKKDRIFFDNIEIGDNKDYKDNKSIFNWKENILLFFEFETIWQKLTDIILKELKNTRELMLVLAKKNNEFTEINKENLEKINKLNEFIKANDMNNKAETMKKKIKNFYEKKQEYERKENIGFINLHRLEDE